MTDSRLPTARLRVINRANALHEMREFALHLLDQGERPWFEVRWPRPEGHHLSFEEWEREQDETFDAVELVNGEIVTLPPYAHLLGEEEYAPEEGFGQ